MTSYEGHALRLHDGLTAFCNLYPVDGRVSWHATTARGWAPMNSYLVEDGDAAVLIDPGLTVHQDLLLRQLREAGTGERDLTILLLRQGEFDCVCNVVPVVKEFGVRRIVGEFPDASLWCDVRPEADLRVRDLHGPIEDEVLRPGGRFAVGDGGRELEALAATLRLLNTLWLYDASSRTLFTSDSFSYVVRPDRAGPWVVTADDDDTTAERIREHLLTTRYWWLRSASVDGIREWLAGVFVSHEVETIAPAFGCILRGRDVVDRHVRMLDAVLEELGDEPAEPVTDRRYEPEAA